MNKKHVRGFTLIEILIVVAVLAAIGGVYYGISKNDTPEDIVKKIVDPRAAAGTECLKQCSAMYGEAESPAGNMCRETCDTAVGKPSGIMPENQTIPKGDTAMQTYTGTVIAGTSAPLLDFVKTDYDAAFKTDKLVVLYFYANWCPICKKEVADALYPAFNDLDRGDVVGFRVNFKDDETDADEETLAKEFGVAYQHTKVFVKGGTRILKSPEGWSKTRYANEIEKAI